MTTVVDADITKDNPEQIQSESEQKVCWQQAKREIHSILNKANPRTLQSLLPKLLDIHLNVYVGLFSKAILEFVTLTYSAKHCTPSANTDAVPIAQTFHCYGIIVAAINAFFPSTAFLLVVRCMHKIFKELFRAFPELRPVFSSESSQRAKSGKMQRGFTQPQLDSIQAYVSFLGLLTSMRVIDTSLILEILSTLISPEALDALAQDDASGPKGGRAEAIFAIVTRVMREIAGFFRLANATGFQKIIDRCRELYPGDRHHVASSALSVRAVVFIEEMFEYFATVTRSGKRQSPVMMEILEGNAYFQLEEMQNTHSISLEGVLSTLNGVKDNDETASKYDPKHEADFFRPIETKDDENALLLDQRSWESTKEHVFGVSSVRFLAFTETDEEVPISDMPPASDDEDEALQSPEEENQTEETEDINFDTSNFLYQVQLGEIRKAIFMILSGSNSAPEASHKLMQFIATKREEEISDRLDTRAIELLVCQILIQVSMHHSSVSRGLADDDAAPGESIGGIFQINPSAGGGTTNAFHTKYYHQIASLLCMSSTTVRGIFENYFKYFYDNASVMSNTNTKLIALLYAFLLKKDSIDWSVLKVCTLEPDSPRNSVHTRVFMKYLFMQLREDLDFISEGDTSKEGELSKRITQEHKRSHFHDIFPYATDSVDKCFKTKNVVGEETEDRGTILADRAEHIRYCVMYFASLGLASIELVKLLEKKYDEFQKVIQQCEKTSAKRPAAIDDEDGHIEEAEPKKLSKLDVLGERLKRIRKDAVV